MEGRLAVITITVSGKPWSRTTRDEADVSVSDVRMDFDGGAD
jgi:hypothetical protein